MLREIRRESGFSPVELLIVMAIICILATTAFPAMSQHRIKVMNSSAASDLKTFKTMMEASFSESQTYPSL